MKEYQIVKNKTLAALEDDVGVEMRAGWELALSCGVVIQQQHSQYDPVRNVYLREMVRESVEQVTISDGAATPSNGIDIVNPVKAAHEEMVREMARDFDKESGGTMKPKSTHLSHVSGTPMPPGKTTTNVNPNDPPVEIQVERPTTLLSLCRRDPEWAARRIGELVEAGEKARKRIQYLRGELRNMGWWDTSEETEDE